MAIHESCEILLALKKSGALRAFKWTVNFESHLPWMEIDAKASLPQELSHLYKPGFFPSVVRWVLKDSLWQDEGVFSVSCGDHEGNVYLRPHVKYLKGDDESCNGIELYSGNGMVLIALIEELGLRVIWPDSNCYDYLKKAIRTADQLVDWAYSRRE